MKNISRISLIFAAIVLVSAATAYSAYMMHKDKDSPIVLETYPEIAGTMLDDCALCHKTGEMGVIGDPAHSTVEAGTCDYCHVLVRENEKHAGLTLNSYGFDYLEAGADAAALKAIASLDSDGDGFVNSSEIAGATFPGDPSSNPDIPQAPHKTFSLGELKKAGLPIVRQDIFMNVSKSREGDTYRRYMAFLLADVIQLADPKDGSTSVDIISVDTYRKTFTLKQLDGTYEQAPPVFGLGADTLGECGWVKYDAPGLEEGTPLPAANVLLAIGMSGREYNPAEYDPATGKLRGYGTFRLVAPQMLNPGHPDISSRATEECKSKVDAKFHYNYDYEKNSDYAVKAVVAIRVNPLPDGTRDYDWASRAMELQKNGELVIYGNIGD